jgi:thiamine pyrophosphate-dependent acetolactate synthase large subunit-like protein
MTGGESLVRCLMAQGVHAIFGMPGGHLECIYDALHRHGAEVRHVLVRNEVAEAFTILGSGRPGPVMLEVPRDVLAAEGPIPEPVLTRPALTMPDGEVVARAARRLKAPIITTQTARGAETTTVIEMPIAEKH